MQQQRAAAARAAHRRCEVFGRQGYSLRPRAMQEEAVGRSSVGLPDTGTAGPERGRRSGPGSAGQWFGEARGGGAADSGRGGGSGDGQQRRSSWSGGARVASQGRGTLVPRPPASATPSARQAPDQPTTATATRHTPQPPPHPVLPQPRSLSHSPAAQRRRVRRRPQATAASRLRHPQPAQNPIHRRPAAHGGTPEPRHHPPVARTARRPHSRSARRHSAHLPVACAAAGRHGTRALGPHSTHTSLPSLSPSSPPHCDWSTHDSDAGRAAHTFRHHRTAVSLSLSHHGHSNPLPHRTPRSRRLLAPQPSPTR